MPKRKLVPSHSTIVPDHSTTAPRQCQQIIDIIERGDAPDAVATVLAEGVNVNWTHPETGLPLLHYAVGADRPGTVRLLLQRGAKVGPDEHGRWPSILALQCECSDEVCDLIEAAEGEKPRPTLLTTVETLHSATFKIPTSLRGGGFEDIRVREAWKARRIKAKIVITKEGNVTIQHATMDAIASAMVTLEHYLSITIADEDVTVTPEETPP